MKFKITESATNDLKRLSAPQRSDLISEIRNALPQFALTDKILKVPKAGDFDVRLHQFGSKIVLYRLDDVDRDGVDDVVVISILDRSDLPKMPEASRADSLSDEIARSVL